MKLSIYKNKYYKRKEEFYHNYCVTKSNFSLNQNKVRVVDIRHVYFELSNMCNYSNIHPRCPVSMQKDKKTLSSNIVKSVIDQLGKNNYKGFIAFHRYNEPLIDPRLFDFISHAKIHCPKSMIRILTNGFYLTQEVVDQFNEIGVEVLEVSAYSRKEYKRLKKLKVRFSYKISPATLDNRKSLYIRNKLNLAKPCYAQINDITINCEGKLSLCCLDWKNKHIFGDLKKDSLKKIINGKNFITTRQNLIQGRRLLDLCSRCDWQR